MDVGLDRLRVVLGWVAIIVWVASFILNAVIPAYEVPATVHGLMLIVAGALFGPSITGRRRNGTNGNERDPR